MSEPFSEFLNRCSTKKNNITHTRIGDKTQNICGGKYHVPNASIEKFNEKYFKHVFTNGNQEYLTEKQLIEDGPILVDVDLRYNPEIECRQHTYDHIQDFVEKYAGFCSEVYDIPSGTALDVYIMEKKDVNRLEKVTKDGIHMLICLKMHKGLQLILREKMLDELSDMWDDLPLLNKESKETWENVLDEGVIKGFSNWQMYGSRKPNHQAYLVKYHLQIVKNNNNSNDWEIKSLYRQDTNTSKQFNPKKHFDNLLARNSKHPEFEIKDEIKDKFEKYKTELKRKERRKQLRLAPDHLQNKKSDKMNASILSISDYCKIKSEEELDKQLDVMLGKNDEEDLNVVNYIYKETHEYTMCLPKSYYGPGSYSNWIMVGWALANTGRRMFLTWLKFSSQDNCRNSLKGANGKFDWRNVPDLFRMWSEFDFDNAHGLTERSIMYWVQKDAPDKYKEIRYNTVQYYIEKTLEDHEFKYNIGDNKQKKSPKTDSTVTEFDIASVLYQMFKDKFVCVSIKNNCWYEYRTHRWHEIDSGNSLRLLISRDLHQRYITLIRHNVNQLCNMEQEDEKYEVIRKRVFMTTVIAQNLKKTVWKNNIMREARELFYDKDFMDKLDQNSYLLCFNNYVVDFKNKEHRVGRPDDYISRCTNIDYFDINTITSNNTLEKKREINCFIDQLFPNKELCDYMWEHLASCLIGTNDNQTFNIYTGSGRNGKSKLVDLMSKGLGDYKVTVPITLITQKRNSIGSTSSEIVQLKGARYAVMQEPSKGDQMNEGILKEITGGDPLQGRALFKDTITFTPQFKLVVCTNTLFDINSMDDGTWRRIRVCDFMSKFLENPFGDPDKFPVESCPYQFKIDKKIDDKFEEWAPILMSMLVAKAYETQGNVKDCKMVLQSSDQYREGQDYFTSFVKEKIQKNPGSKVKKTELAETFKQWYQENYGRKPPNNKELNEFMVNRYGVYKCGWKNIAIVYDEDDED